MKASKNIIIALLCIVLLLPSLNVFASDSKEKTYIYTVGGVNAYPKANAVNVYFSAYGDEFTPSDAYTVYIIKVENGRAVGFSENETQIPDNGFLVVVRGSKLINQIKDLGLKEGDAVIFDEKGSEILFISDDFSPYYENKINYNFFNGTRTADTIVIYDRGSKTNTNMWGYEVVVNADGFVSAVGGNDNIIPEGGYVVSAVGRTRIAELTEAAVLGLKATVDKATKTVTFAFAPECVSGTMKVKYDSFIKETEKAKASYACLDYSALENVRSEMEALCNRGKSDDLSVSLLAKYDFEKLYDKSVCLLIENPAVEGRGIWVRPSDSDTAEKVKANVKRIYDAGFNAICIEMLFNSVTIFPVDTQKYGFSQDPALKGFDVLKAYIDECHRYGIEIFGWMVVYRVSHGSTTYPDLAVTAKHPEWLCKAQSGTTDVGDTKGKFLNPALPEVRQFLLSFYEYIFNTYDLDGFQLDYIRYPFAEGENFGFDDYTLKLYEEKYGASALSKVKNGQLSDEWYSFLGSFVTDFVCQVKELANRIRPDMYLSAAYAPDLRSSYKTHMQQAKIWLEEQKIDIGFPMSYGTAIVPLYASFTVDAAGDDTYSYIGIGDYGAEILNREIVETRQSGAEGFAFFGSSQFFNGTYEKEMKDGILKVPSVSPSYDADVAVSEQANFIIKRLEIAKKINPEGVSPDIEKAIHDACIFLFTGRAHSMDEIKALAEISYTALGTAKGDKTLIEVLKNDIAKMIKIIRLSKDIEKDKYRETHPLPEPYTPKDSLGYCAVESAVKGIENAENQEK